MLKPTNVSLHIPPQMWSEFRSAMINSRSFNEEVIGFFFCQRQQISKHQVRYIPKSWVVPTADCYEHQSTYGLVLNQEFHSYLLEKHLQPGMDIVHIHTHAGVTTPDFSAIDDQHEATYARFLTSGSAPRPRLISGVFNEELQNNQFRLWNRRGSRSQTVRFCNSLFDLPDQPEPATTNDLMFARQKIFGLPQQQRLGNLKVALIGCGGIGSIFAELLGRLGVKNWVLVDPDRRQP
jgi:molybdopterin-synthase adenylyltransferase